MHDFFLFKNKEKIYLDAPKYNIKKLKEKLDLYKLNRNVEICEKKIHSYYLFYGKLSNKIFLELKKEINLKIFNDPRNMHLGYRVICYNKEGKKQIIKIIKNLKIILNYKEYEKKRILNCIPDIKKDRLYNKAYLLQYNFENLNSICWKKGCFIGQEVTIKMKNKGTLKKRIYTVKSIRKELTSPKEIKYKNISIGETTSHCENIALALVQEDKIKNIKKIKNILII